MSKSRRCGHRDWQQCECDKPIRDAYAETNAALNALGNEFKAWCQRLPHQSSCTSFEIGYCGCHVHDAFKTLDTKYRHLQTTIERTYADAVG